MKTLTRAWNATRAAFAAARNTRGATPHAVIWRSGPVRLRAYRPEELAPGATPLLLVTPIINRFRVVDLEPETSLVGGLLRRGVPVYLVDWGDPRRIDAATDFRHYVTRFLPRAVDAAVAHAGQSRMSHHIRGETRRRGEQLPPGAAPRASEHQRPSLTERRSSAGAREHSFAAPGPVDVLGYCLGGTIATVFAATYPEHVRRLVTVCAPVRFSSDDELMDLMRLWVEPGHFPVDALTGAFGTMPGSLIHQGFVWQRPVASALKFPNVWKRFEDRAFTRSFALLEAWTWDGVDIPGAAYRTLIQDLYRDDALSQGRFRLGDLPVDLGRIRCPVLVVTADRDTTCPPRAARALLDRVGTPADQRSELSLRGGHVAAVVGRRAPDALHGPLTEWLLA